MNLEKIINIEKLKFPAWIILAVLGLVLGTATYYGFLAEFHYRNTIYGKSETIIDGKINGTVRPMMSNSNSDIMPSGGTSTPLALPTATPSPSQSSDEQEKPITEELPGNITDLYIANDSGRYYFFSEEDNKIEVFVNDALHKSIRIGKGVRQGDRISAQLESQLTKENGALELKISKGGRELTGRFVPLDDPKAPGKIRLIRSSS